MDLDDMVTRYQARCAERMETRKAEIVAETDLDELWKQTGAFVQCRNRELAAACIDRMVELEPSERSHYRAGMFYWVHKETPEDLRRVFEHMDAATQYGENPIYHTNYGAILLQCGAYAKGLMLLHCATNYGDEVLPHLLLADFFSRLEAGELDLDTPDRREEIDRAKAEGFISDSGRYLRNAVSLIRANPEKNGKIHLAESGNEVFIVERPGVVELPTMECTSQVRLLAIKHLPTRQAVFESVMLKTMRKVIADRGYAHFRVPRVILSGSEDEYSYLATEYVRQRSFSEKLAAFTGDRAQGGELWTDIQRLVQFLAISHVVGTDSLADIHDMENEFGLHRYDLAVKARERLEAIPVTDGLAKREAIARIMDHYAPVVAVLDALPWVYNRDAHAAQWLVPDFDEEGAISGVDWEYRLLAPITHDYVNLFDTFPGLPFERPHLNLLILDHLAEYNIEKAHYLHNARFHELWPQMEPYLNRLHAAQSAALRDGDYESAVWHGAVSVIPCSEWFPEMEGIYNYSDIVNGYSQSRIQRAIEHIGAWCSRGQNLDRIDHMFGVALTGVEEILRFQNVDPVPYQEIRQGLEMMRSIMV